MLLVINTLGGRHTDKHTHAYQRTNQSNFKKPSSHAWFKKPTKMSQELKSKLRPNINDTLMHCQEASTTWLWIARFAFTDGILLTL